MPLTGECVCQAEGSYGPYCQHNGLEEGATAGKAIGPLLTLFMLGAGVGSYYFVRSENEWWKAKRAKQAEGFTLAPFKTANLLYFLIVVVDVLTSLAFIFQRSIPWHESIRPVQTGIQGTLLILSQETFYPILVVCFIIALLYAIFLLPFMIRRSSGEAWIQSWLSRPSPPRWTVLWQAAPLLSFICSLGYTAILNTFFRTLACTYRDVGVAPYVDATPSVVCWSSTHGHYAALGIIGIIVFLPCSLATKPRYDLRLNNQEGAQEIFVKPTFALLVLMADTATAAVSTFCSHYPVLIVLMTLLSTLLIVVAMYVSKPITPTSVQRVRYFCHLLIFWCGLCGLLAALINSETSLAPLIALLVGFLLTGVTWIGMAAGFIRRPKDALHAMMQAMGAEPKYSHFTSESDGDSGSGSASPSSPVQKQQASADIDIDVKAVPLLQQQGGHP